MSNIQTHILVRNWALNSVIFSCENFGLHTWREQSLYFPGGFGTLDEFFEILTLSQTRKLNRPILILLYGSSYWNEIVNFQALVRHGMISDDDLSLFHFVDSPNEALEALKHLKVESEKKCPALAKSSTTETEEPKYEHPKRPTTCFPIITVYNGK